MAERASGGGRVVRRSGRTKRPKCDQLTFDRHQWGGTRPGAGRKRQPGSGVPHRRRERLSHHHPVHVTVRLVAGLPSLRSYRVFPVLQAAFDSGRSDRNEPRRPRGARTKARSTSAAIESDDAFRLVHYSIQSNHLHLIVEARDELRLSRALQGLLIRVAKGLNKLWRRSGRVLADRYHARALTSPRQVRNALAYVFNNARKHGQRLAPGQHDPFSSSVHFDGWDHAEPLTAPSLPTFLSRARTWLLNQGWRRHGLLVLATAPNTA